ncbi:MAG: hypothetical protein ACOYNF_19950, partial [Rhodoferax sp.]
MVTNPLASRLENIFFAFLASNLPPPVVCAPHPYNVRAKKKPMNPFGSPANLCTSPTLAQILADQPLWFSTARGLVYIDVAEQHLSRNPKRWTSFFLIGTIAM